MIVMTAMMMGLIMVMTYIPKVPVPATQGYVHLGDCMIFFGVLLLGWKYGAVAAGLGSALADVLGSYFQERYKKLKLTMQLKIRLPKKIPLNF